MQWTPKSYKKEIPHLASLFIGTDDIAVIKSKVLCWQFLTKSMIIQLISLKFNLCSWQRQCSNRCVQDISTTEREENTYSGNKSIVQLSKQ
jgi:ABC-type arginine/histidine transport system permease subunit